ncbi:MAG: NAD(P)/FAD-dependent oxidoreductase [Polyangia bacterium]
MEHLDVVIVGAGLSGIGAAVHLQGRCPSKRYAILEGRKASGGTWDLFRYPGLRSDSDMFTLGYAFRPWQGEKAIADGPSILAYVRDTAREHRVEEHIRYEHRVLSASWSSTTARWTVEVRANDAEQELSCSFLYICSGYYDYDKGHTPELPGRERFAGQVIHPQHWPEDLDYAGKRIVVLGSGATAVTLVPTLAEKAAHVTMLQRSPTYVVTLPSKDRVADRVRSILPASLAHKLVRAKNVLVAQLFFQVSRRAPKLAKKMIRAGVVKELPAGYDVDRHFAPRYDPWDQRVCFVPDSDLFRAISAGRASIVTDRVRTLVEDGIELESGEKLPADILVTATGLELLALGGIALVVDGAEVDLAKTYTYKGVMLGNVPNLAFCVGYTNASWTLRADLSSGFVASLIAHMERRAFRQVRPAVDAGSMMPQPILDLSSGYVRRSVDRFPKQGTAAPWTLRQNYVLDMLAMKLGELEDGTLRFSE